MERISKSVIGPLSDIEFIEHPIVAKLGPIDWRTPTNPQPEPALVGQRTFYLYMSAMFVAVLIIPIALIAFVVRLSFRARRPLSLSDYSAAERKADP